MRLLLLTDDEAAFLEAALDEWAVLHGGDIDAETDRLRVDRFQVLRKLAGKYLDVEREQIAPLALELLGS
jgi:hypothetical protein